MSETELRVQIAAMQVTLRNIEDDIKDVKHSLAAVNEMSGRVVRLETQMKIALGIIGAGGLGFAGLFGLGG